MESSSGATDKTLTTKAQVTSETKVKKNIIYFVFT